MYKNPKDTMENLVEVTDGDADMLKLGIAQNICYLCGKEFKYRIQLKKHLRKFHNDAEIDTEFNAPTGNVKVEDDIKIVIERKQEFDIDVVSAKFSTDVEASEADIVIGTKQEFDIDAVSAKFETDVEASEAAINETTYVNNAVSPDSDDHSLVGDNNNTEIGETGFGCFYQFHENACVANRNENLTASDDGEASMNFQELIQNPNGMSDLSNSTETFTGIGTGNEDTVEAMIVLGKRDKKYTRSKPDTSSWNYGCEKCDQRFKFPNQLKRHTEVVHEGKFPYSCEICGKSFDRISTVKDHMLVHTDDRPHKCEQCGAAFKMKGSLKKHIIRHDAEKIYKCEHCTSRFMFREQLIAHLIVHTGDKPFCCDVCKKTFARKSYLKEHMVVHTTEKKYPCSMCDKVFLRPYSRKVHMRNHMEQKPHQCSICSASFSQRCALVQHIRRHTGERPFTCLYCDRRFVQQSSMLVHAAKHTDVKNTKSGI